MQYGKEYIEKMLPHRTPMLLVDTVEYLNPGKEIHTTFYVDPAMEIFKGHFPGNPILPGVYTLESMGQAASIMFLALERYTGTMPLFIGIDQAAFLRKIIPGSTLEVRAEFLKENEDKGIVTAQAQAIYQGELAARAKVSLAMR